MVTTSMKRIIWGLGWMFLWVLQDFFYLKAYPMGFKTEEIVALMNLMILLIPLMIFKDDPEPSYKTENPSRTELSSEGTAQLLSKSDPCAKGGKK